MVGLRAYYQYEIFGDLMKCVHWSCYIPIWFALADHLNDVARVKIGDDWYVYRLFNLVPGTSSYPQFGLRS